MIIASLNKFTPPIVIKKYSLGQLQSQNEKAFYPALSIIQKSKNNLNNREK